MDEEQMRAKFEAWWASEYPALDVEKIDAPFKAWADFAYVGWQAALSAKSVPDGYVLVPIEIISKFPELNLSNYSYEDIVNINEWGIEVCQAAPQPTDDRVRELEKDAARYRWLRDHYPGFASYRSGVIPYVNLDSEVDKQIAYRKRSHE